MKAMFPFPDEELIRLALREDLGPGDVTTDNLVGPDAVGKGIVVAKESLVLAGIEVAKEVFAMLDPDIRFETAFCDGAQLVPTHEVFRVSGRVRPLLAGERTALNFLQRLSGIATLTRQFVDRVAGTNVRLTDTRKTAPGWRRLEKYAVRVGGAYNHRFGLFDGILIKDNHIKACGGITAAVERIRQRQGHLLRIEVEVTNLDEVEEALKNKVDVIMLDNMNVREIKEAVKLIKRCALVEVSGGVTLGSVAELAATGVDIISIGALTHSARAVDMSMRIIE
jgi:nicotinate-nucleotide pyrophosphorylase (carboxylating)